MEGHVQRRVQLDNLRGMDPVMLEVTITDALRKPLGQLEPITLADLLALAESDDAPKSLQPMLLRFQDRVGREIADIPDGGSWAEFIGELRALQAARVPAWLRGVVASEAAREGRAAATVAVAAAAAEAWADTEPEPFSLGSRAAPVTRTKKTARGTTTAPKRARSTTARRTTARAPDPIDEIRQKYLIQKCLERLAQYEDRGLAEQILLVGIRKQAEETYPDVRGTEVLGALKTMEDRGMARKTAKRWILERRW
jgi:hypothetical protein